MIKYILDRLKEKSTIGTIITLVVGAFGLAVTPEQSEAIIGAVTAIVSAIAIFTPSK